MSEFGREIYALLDSGLKGEQLNAALMSLFETQRQRPRRWHEKDLSGPCYVYCLVNPKLRNRPFYIGISKNPWSRYRNHLHDASSAAWSTLQDLWLYGGFEIGHILKIYKECPDRNTALDLEHRLITTTPGLVNRDRRRSQMFEYRQ